MEPTDLPEPSVTVELPVAEIQVDPDQPRKSFDPDELAELADSIRRLGVLQPLLVRPGEHGWVLVAGERRLRAASLAGLATVPVFSPPQRSLPEIMALVENVQRVRLTPLEEAKAYQSLIDKYDFTHKDISITMSISRSRVSHTLKYLELPEYVGNLLSSGVITPGHADAISSLPEKECEALARCIVSEGLSVQTTRERALLRDYSAPGDPHGAGPTRPSRPEMLDFVQAELEDKLSTRVKVTGSGKKGLVSIHFADLADLRRQISILGFNVKEPGSD